MISKASDRTDQTNQHTENAGVRGQIDIDRQAERHTESVSFVSL